MTVKLEDTLEALLEGIQLISYEWEYLYLNESVVQQSKKKREELLNHTMMECYPGIENTDMFAVLERCMNERTSAQLDNHFTYPDGSHGWFELRIEPVPEGIFILSLDITERKLAEEERAQRMEDLEKVVHMTSHRIRKPVANILAVSAMLDDHERPIRSVEMLQEIVDYMRDSAKMLDKFTSELSVFLDQMSSGGKRRRGGNAAPPA